MKQIPEEPAEQDQQASVQEYQDTEEYAEHGEHGDEPNQQQDGDQGDDDDAYHLQELANVLTVTWKKLQSTVLVRKFTGRPRTIEERKKTSTCTACGMLGHWAGDTVCTASNKDKDKTFSKGAGKHGKDGKGNPDKKAFMVIFPGEPPQDQLPDSSGPSTSLENPSAFFIFVATHMVEHDPFTNYITEIINYAGHMIVDTACQRSCCSDKWLDVHSKILMNFGFKPHVIDVADHFQFGSGIHKAAKRADLPAALPGQLAEGLLLGVSVLKDAQIPFLPSNTACWKNLVVWLTPFVKDFVLSSLGLVFHLNVCMVTMWSTSPVFRRLHASLMFGTAFLPMMFGISLVSLHSKRSKATYADLMAMYDAVDHLRQTSNKGFKMNPTAVDDSTIVLIPLGQC